MRRSPAAPRWKDQLAKCLCIGDNRKPVAESFRRCAAGTLGPFLLVVEVSIPNENKRR